VPGGRDDDIANEQEPDAIGTLGDWPQLTYRQSR
jgi:hypothetical protein